MSHNVLGCLSYKQQLVAGALTVRATNKRIKAEEDDSYTLSALLGAADAF